MPTPVGPAPRDPNDPDFWDWGDDDDAWNDEFAPRRRHSPVYVAVAIIVVIAFAALLVMSRP